MLLLLHFLFFFVDVYFYFVHCAFVRGLTQHIVVVITPSSSNIVRYHTTKPNNKKAVDDNNIKSMYADETIQWDGKQNAGTIELLCRRNNNK